MNIFDLISEIAGLLADLAIEAAHILEPVARTVGTNVSAAARWAGRNVRAAAIATAHATRDAAIAARDAVEDAHTELTQILERIKVVLGIATVYLLIMVLVACYGPHNDQVRQNLVAVMALVPIALIVALIVIYIRLNHLLAVGAVNVAIKATAKWPKVQGALKDIVAQLKKLAGAVLVAVLGGFALTGVVLYTIPVQNDPGLVLFAFLLGISILAFGKNKKLRTVLVLLLIGTVVVFFIGGRSHVPSVAQATATIQNLNASAPPPPGYDEGRVCTTERAPLEYLAKTPADFGGNRFFGQHAIIGCFAKVVLPSFSDYWGFQTLNPQQPGDWTAIRCANGQIARRPLSPNLNDTWSCPGNTPLERHTIFVQTNTDLVWRAS